MAREAQPAKVAFVSHHFRKNDGQGRVNYEVVKASLEDGYQVVVLGTSCADDLAFHQNCTFVQIGNDALPTELLRNIVFARGTARWLRKHRNELDLVLANGFVTWEACDVVAAHFVHAAWAKSKWYPPTTLSPYSLYRRLYTVINTRWEKPAFVRARLVIAVSRVLVKELVDIGVPEERIEVVWNGVDTDQFHPGEANRDYFNLPPNIPIALFVVIFVRRERISTLCLRPCNWRRISILRSPAVWPAAHTRQWRENWGSKSASGSSIRFPMFRG